VDDGEPGFAQVSGFTVGVERDLIRPSATFSKGEGCLPIFALFQRRRVFADIRPSPLEKVAEGRMRSLQNRPYPAFERIIPNNSGVILPVTFKPC
jgi:hypothetical protein